jgi:hypothetical protein
MTETYAPPATEQPAPASADALALERIERWVVEKCRGLGLQVGSADDNFFAVGGSSLGASRLIADAERTFGEGALPPGEFYRNGVLHKVAEVILANGSAAAGPC